MLDLLASYAVPTLAAAAIGLATGWFGGRGLAGARSLAAALALACAAIALHDSLAAPGRIGLWTESALILAAAYAAAYTVGAGAPRASRLPAGERWRASPHRAAVPQVLLE